MSITEMIDACAKCRTEQEADAVLEQIIAETQAERPDLTRGEIRDIALSNVGYLTGYCDTATHDRILKLFRTQHPIFGLSNPTPEEAFAAGLKYGEESRRKKGL